MRRFFAPPDRISNGTVELSIDETRHLRDVLRLSVGHEVNVFDGLGNEYVCTITSIGKNTSELEIARTTSPASPESPLDLTMAVAVLKGDKFDLVVQKLVELGANTIVPLITARTDVDPRGIDKRVSRWRRIALEATKQCGRARLTEITEGLAFDDLISRSSATNLVMFAESNGQAFSDVNASAALTAMVGPEGGWDDTEVAAAERSHAAIVTFGGRILRAETAAISFAAVLQHRFGDLH